MSAAAARFRRLMLLLPRLVDRGDVSVPALAEEFGISAAHLVADLGALVERYDDPAGFMPSVSVLFDGDRVGVRSSHFRRPMRITGRELCALELGLALLARRRELPETVELRERLARVITTLPRDRAYQGVHDGALGDEVSVRWLAALRRALRGRRVVELSYQSASHAEPMSRVVRPYALVAGRGRWYLVGWCERSGEERVFRTDRIVSLDVREATHQVPADFQLERMVIEDFPFTRATITEELVVRYSPAIARWIAERDGGPLEQDGSAVRRMPLADREWAIRHVLQYGPDVEVMEPAGLRGEIVERLRGS